MEKVMEIDLPLTGNLLDRVSQGTLGAKANSIVYLREDVAGDTLDFTKITTPVEKVAVFLPISPDMAEDEPAIKAYVKQRFEPFMVQAAESYVARQIEKAAKHAKPRFWESNKRARARAFEEASKGGLIDPDVLHSLTAPALSRDTMLIGNLRAALTLWKKGTVNLKITNSHLDYFHRNMFAIRGEQRLAVTVYRPEGLVVLHLRTWPRLKKLFGRR